MPSLSEIIERNRTHSEHPYIVLAELALPDGTTIRLARDPRSWAWPNIDATTGTLSAPADTIAYTLREYGAVTVSLDAGIDAGTIELQRQAGTTWETVASFTKPDAVQIDAQPAATYRLIAGELFEGEVRGIISGPGSHIWQAFNFDLGQYREGEGARRATLQLRVSNANGIALRWMEQLEDWRKANGREPVGCRLIIVNTNLLAEAAPTAEYVFQDASISCAPPMDWIAIEVGGPDVWGAVIGRRILRDYCTWRQVEDCPHVRTCDHTLTRCREIAASLDPGRNELFGGVPFCGKGAHYVL